MLDYPLELLARVLDARLQDPNGVASKATVRRVSTDSRQISPGDLFVAISGEKFDGHQYVKQALEAGAVSAIVAPERVPAGVGPLLEVPDPLLALGTLGAWHRNRYSARVVAVTGSVGKTTTKDLLHSVLSQAGPTLKNPGNLNAEIGVPLTLLQLRPEHKFAVVEMAMRGEGQIRYLARLARPEVALITLIGLSHIELLGSQDAIAAAKAEVLDFLPLGGTAVLNADDPYFSFLSSRVPAGAGMVPFGMGPAAARGVSGSYLGQGAPQGDRSSSAKLGSRFTLRTLKARGIRWAWLPLLGEHNVRNALAAAGVGDALGVSPQRILRGLAEAEISGSRMTVRPLPNTGTLLDDAYNASTPEAVIGALRVLQETQGLRRIAVLGAMLELGDASEAAHRRVGEYVAATPPDLLVTVGGPSTLIAETAQANGMPGERILACESKEQALAALLERRQSGDVLLVKGSRGVAMESMVTVLTGSTPGGGK